MTTEAEKGRRASLLKYEELVVEAKERAEEARKAAEVRAERERIGEP